MKLAGQIKAVLENTGCTKFINYLSLLEILQTDSIKNNCRSRRDWSEFLRKQVGMGFGLGGVYIMYSPVHTGQDNVMQ